MRKQTKIAALVSAAALLAIGASMTSFAKWVPVGDGSSIWVDSYGDPEAGWHRYQATGEYYCTDDDGRVITNSLISADGYVDDLTADTVYYVGADGTRQKEYWVSVSNDEEVPTGTLEEGVEYVPSTLYLYATAKRSLAKGSAPLAVSAYRTSAKADKGIFVFDSNGYMMGGTVQAKDSNGNDGTYYCVTTDDLADNLIELEEGTLAEKYVEGQALVGWAKFYDSSLAADDKYEWRYYDNGKLVTGKTMALSWQGKTSTYYFDSVGNLTTSAFTRTATMPNASGADAASVTFETKNNDGVIVTQTGWYSEDADSDGVAEWYYLVNVIDNKHSLVRAVVFNAEKGGKNRAKVIDGKTYVFDNTGKMLDGIQTIDSTYTDKDWYGIKCTKLTEGKKYYFNSKPNSGHRGEKEDGRVTYTVGDLEVTSYVDPVQGLMTNAIIKDYYYDSYGYLYTALDDTYEIVPLSTINYKDLKSYKVVSGKTLDKDGDAIIKTDTDVTGKYIIVDRNGKVLKSGNKKIGDTTYRIDNYVAEEVTK